MGWAWLHCRVLTDELEQTRNMLQHLQDSLVQDDRPQLKVYCTTGNSFTNKKFSATVQQLVSDNEQLQSNNELLQVRLTSLLAMFDVQEAAVTAKEVYMYFT